MLQRSLQWVAKAKPQDIAGKMPLDDAAERRELVAILARYPTIFSRDGRFPPKTIAATVSLLQAMGNSENAAEVQSLIDSRWIEPAA